MILSQDVGSSEAQGPSETDQGKEARILRIFSVARADDRKKILNHLILGIRVDQQ